MQATGTIGRPAMKTTWCILGIVGTAEDHVQVKCQVTCSGTMGLQADGREWKGKWKL